MSAIIIQPPSERSSLLPKSKTKSIQTLSSIASTSSANHTPDPSGSKHLDRSTPLKDTISPARFVILCLGIWSSNFTFAFQATAIPTLAPSISSGFNHAELNAYLGSVFSLASAAVIPIYGVLMDSLGRKFAMVTGCLFFGIGTIFCAYSGTIYHLLAARALAGMGGGGMLTVSSVITTDLVPLRDRGYYQGIMMTVFGAGTMIGGPVAGWLADHYGWPLSFLVQVPMILVCILLVTTLLPPSIIPPSHTSLLKGLYSIDWPGSILLLGSITTLILGFSFHTSYLEPWSAPIVWGLLLASGISLTAFVWVETKVKRPLVPMSLLKSRHRVAIMLSGFFLSVGNQAFSFQIPVYFSVVVGTSTAQAGVLLSICGGLGLAIGSLLAGQHIRNGGRYRMLGFISLIPAVIASFTAALWRPSWPQWAYYATYFPASLGYSVFLCCQLVALISAVDSKAMPKATALLYTIRTIGGTLGVSVGGSIQLGALTSGLRKRFGDILHREEIITSILHSKSAISLLPPTLKPLALEAYASSLSTVWAVTGFLAILTLISAWFVQEKDVSGQPHGERDLKASGGGVVEGGFGEGLGGSTADDLSEE